VNYNSGEFAIECTRSLRNEWVAGGFDPGALEIILIDNASPVDQRSVLDQLEFEGVKVVAANENLGYAGAVQLALGNSSGGEDDYVAVLNPDIHFLPGSVRALIHYLEEHPECGAVAPRAYLDEECTFQLPNVPLPGAVDEVLSTLGQCSPRLAGFLGRLTRKAALKQWRTTEPLERKMLSGCCLFMSRASVDQLNGMILDPRYPLYYEDADLCRRLRGQRLELVYQPRARILHHWSRSAGAGADFAAGPLKRWEASRRAYMGRYLGRLGEWTTRAAKRLLDSIPMHQRGLPAVPIQDRGPMDGAPRFSVPHDGRVLFELAMTPTFGLSAGHIGDGGAWEFPAVMWDWLFEGTYFLRATELKSGRFVGAWSFTKTAPARTHPVSAQGGPKLGQIELDQAGRSYSEQIRWEQAG